MGFRGFRTLPDQRAHLPLGAGGSSGITYLLRDEFTTAAAAPLASPRTCEPGPGLWTVTDTGNNASISSGKLAIAGGSQAVILETQTLSVVAGRAAIVQFNHAVNEVDPVSWAAFTRGLAINGGGTVWYVRNGGYVQIPTVGASSNDYVVAMVLTATGWMLFIKPLAGTWKLYWITAESLTSNKFRIGKEALASTMTSDFYRVRDLPAPLNGSLATLSVTPSGQSLGAELLTNGNMEAGDPPSSWTPSASVVLDAAADERTGGAGAQSLSITRTTSGSLYASQGITCNVGDILEVSGWVKNVDTSSGVQLIVNNGATTVHGAHTATTWKQFIGLFRQSSATKNVRVFIFANADGQSALADDVVAKVVTRNTAQTMPADAIIDLNFTLPGSPIAGQEISLCYRIAAAGEEYFNCWKASLKRDGSNVQWDLLVDSIAAGTVTRRLTVTGIGTPTAIRVICEGSLHDLYSLAGSTWTKRGAQINISHQNTSTGLNVIANTGFTVGTLEVYKRTDAAWTAELDRV